MIESPKRRNCLYGSCGTIRPFNLISEESGLKRTVGAVARISFAGALKGTMLAISDIRAGKGTDKPWAFSTIPKGVEEGLMERRGASDYKLGVGGRYIDIRPASLLAGSLCLCEKCLLEMVHSFTVMVLEG